MTVAPTWSPIGPATLMGVAGLPCGGLVSAIEVSPDYDGNGLPAMYLGTEGGGVWRSINFEDPSPSWVPLTDHVPGLTHAARVGVTKVPTIAVDPNDPRTLYAGTRSDSTPVIKSTDGGDTWGAVNEDFPLAGGLRRVLVAPNGDVYAGFDAGGLWRSDDGGASWSTLPGDALAGVAIRDLAWNFATGDLLAGVVDGEGDRSRSGIWSFDQQVWTQTAIDMHDLHGNAFVAADINHVRLSSSAVGAVASLSRPDLGINDAFGNPDPTQSVGLLNVFRLTGGTWASQWRKPDGWDITQGGYCQVVCLAPDERIYSGAIGISQSAGGTNYVDIFRDRDGVNVHVDHHAIAAFNSRVYVGNDGGIFRCTPDENPGVPQWESLNTASLRNFLATGASIDPSDPDVALVGTQDNGLAYNGDGQWRYLQKSWEDENVRFAPTTTTGVRRAYFADYGGFFWSQDGGASFQRFGPDGLDATWAPLALHPLNAERLLVAGPTVFEILDVSSGQWNEILQPAESPGAACYAMDNSTYIGSGSTLFRRRYDGGAFDADPFDFGGAIVGICLDRTNPDHLYVATRYKVLRRLSDASMWEDVTGDRPLNINDMVVVASTPSADPWLFVGTDAGVLLGTALGTTTHWIRYGSAQPDTAVTDLSIDEPRRLLISATWGRGAWGLPVGVSSPSVEIQVPAFPCGGGPVVGDLAAVHATVTGLADPLTYLWTSDQPIVGPSTNGNISIQLMTPQANISVVVTDAEGETFHASTSFSATTPNLARLDAIICHLMKEFRIRPIPDPEWIPRIGDATRHWTRQNLTAIQALASQLEASIAAILEQGSDPGRAVDVTRHPRSAGLSQAQQEGL